MLSGSKRLGTTCLETPILWKQKDFLTQLGLPWGNKESVAWNQDNVIVRLCISDKYFKSCLRRNIKFVLYTSVSVSHLPVCLSLCFLSIFYKCFCLTPVCHMPRFLSLCYLSVHYKCFCLSHFCQMSVTRLSHVCHLSVTCLCHLSVNCLSHGCQINVTCLSHVCHLSDTCLYTTVNMLRQMVMFTPPPHIFCSVHIDRASSHISLE